MAFNVKIPGETGATSTLMAGLITGPVVARTSTSIVALEISLSSTGNWTSICTGDTANNGAATPLTKTRVPASLVGSGTPAAAEALVPSLKEVPNSEKTNPGAST